MDPDGSSRKTTDAAPTLPKRPMSVIEIKPPRPAPAQRPALLGPEPVSAHSLWNRLPPDARRHLVGAARWARRSRARIAWGAVVVAVVVLVLFVVAAQLAQSEPSWWRGASMRTTSMQDLARRVENGAITHITADHQGGTAEAVEWPVKLSDDGANAWLNLRLPVWLPRLTADSFEDVTNARGEVVESRPVDGVTWPDSVEEIRVAFVNDRFRIGARVRTGEGTRVFGATLAPRIDDEGSLWMEATSVSVGKIGMPAWFVFGDDGGKLRDYLPESLLDSAQGQAIFSKLAGKTPMFDDAVIRIGDGRRVRLLSLEVASDSLVAWFRTE